MTLEQPKGRRYGYPGSLESFSTPALGLAPDYETLTVTGLNLCPNAWFAIFKMAKIHSKTLQQFLVAKEHPVFLLPCPSMKDEA